VKVTKEEAVAKYALGTEEFPDLWRQYRRKCFKEALGVSLVPVAALTVFAPAIGLSIRLYLLLVVLAVVCVSVVFWPRRQNAGYCPTREQLLSDIAEHKATQVRGQREQDAVIEERTTARREVQEKLVAELVALPITGFQVSAPDKAGRITRYSAEELASKLSLRADFPKRSGPSLSYQCTMTVQRVGTDEYLCYRMSAGGEDAYGTTIYHYADGI
jgi:hypothetical protein